MQFFQKKKLIIQKNDEIKEILIELGVLYKQREDNFLIEHYSKPLDLLFRIRNKR